MWFETQVGRPLRALRIVDARYLGGGRTGAAYQLDVSPGGVLSSQLNAERIGKLRETLVDACPPELKGREGA